MKQTRVALALGALAALAGLEVGCMNPAGLAHMFSRSEMAGAVWVTDANGGGVPGNIFASKDDVFMNGGAAPDSSEGLHDGDWVVGVTDPTGATLLSPLPLKTVHVRDGKFDNLVALAPFDDTTDGIYKVWAMPAEGYPSEGGDSQSGFDPRSSRTDDFRVQVASTGGNGGGGGGGDPDGNGCPNTYGAVYGDLFGDIYGDIYGDLYGDQFGDLHGNLYGNRFGDMFGNQYGDQYGDFYGDQFGDRYGTLYGTMHGDMFGNQTGDIHPGGACPPS